MSVDVTIEMEPSDWEAADNPRSLVLLTSMKRMAAVAKQRVICVSDADSLNLHDKYPLDFPMTLDCAAPGCAFPIDPDRFAKELPGLLERFGANAFTPRFMDAVDELMKEVRRMDIPQSAVAALPREAEIPRRARLRKSMREVMACMPEREGALRVDCADGAWRAVGEDGGLPSDLARALDRVARSMPRTAPELAGVQCASGALVLRVDESHPDILRMEREQEFADGSCAQDSWAALPAQVGALLQIDGSSRLAWSQTQRVLRELQDEGVDLGGAVFNFHGDSPPCGYHFVGVRGPAARPAAYRAATVRLQVALESDLMNSPSSSLEGCDVLSVRVDEDGAGLQGRQVLSPEDLEEFELDQPAWHPLINFEDVKWRRPMGQDELAAGLDAVAKAIRTDAMMRDMTDGCDEPFVLDLESKHDAFADVHLSGAFVGADGLRRMRVHFMRHGRSDGDPDSEGSLDEMVGTLHESGGEWRCSRTLLECLGTQQDPLDGASVDASDAQSLRCRLQSALRDLQMAEFPMFSPGDEDSCCP